MNLLSLKHEQGVGLIEVLIALLLLAVAILGFSALQINALKSTDESVLRSRAMTVMRSGAEIMRSNHETIEHLKTELNRLQDVSTATTATPSKNCIDDACTAQELAEQDATILHNYAVNNEVQIRIEDCAGTTGSQIRQCMIVSWGETSANFLGEDNSCANDQGVYMPRATCFIMEAY